MGKRNIKYWDVILKTAMLAISLYLLLSTNVVKGMTLLYTSITIAKAETFIRILGVVLLALSVSLILRDLVRLVRKTDAEDRPNEKKHLDWLVISGFAALLLYMPLMRLVGFTVSSILLMTCFTFIIRAREKRLDLHNKQILMRNFGVSVGYAIVLVFVLELLFTKALHVRLP